MSTSSPLGVIALLALIALFVFCLVRMRIDSRRRTRPRSRRKPRS